VGVAPQEADQILGPHPGEVAFWSPHRRVAHHLYLGFTKVDLEEIRRPDPNEATNLP
jgi:hypothetical protein